MRFLTSMFGCYHGNRRRTKSSATAGIVDMLETRVLLTAVNLADEEQLILELINRARANPEAEATRLGISLNAGLEAGTISPTPKQPLAPNQQLQNASVGHTEDMINRDFFAHTNPSGVTASARATAAGYNWSTIAENIAYIGYFGSPDIDANSRQAHDLLFQSAGHRRNILMPEIEEIGIGSRSGAFIPSGGNANLITENFGRRNLNPIITGVVYSDTNNSDFYDIGEAVRSGTITALRVSDGATFSNTIGISGGYGLIVPAGSYVVTAEFTRNGTAVTMSSNVTVSVDNVKVDFDATAAVVVNLALSSPAVTMTETGTTATMQFTVTRTGNVTGPLTVNLSTNDTSELSAPASVVIPDGQSSVNFTVTALADGIIDGTQSALVQASAVGAVTVNRGVTVADTTVPSFTVNDLVTTTLRPTFSWIGISNAASYEILVVQIATTSSVFHRQAGITSTSFTMPVDLPLGTYYIRLRAITSTGLSSAWGPIQMIRSRPEPPVASVTLALSSPAVTMTETGTTATMQFTVTRTGNVTGPLTVNLSTNDTSELSVPASVVIPDGQSSVDFTVTALADGIIDGTQTALVQASAVDAVAVNRSISVADTTVPSFTVNDLLTTTLRPTFSWIGISNAASYEILVVQIATTSSVFHRQAGITSTSFTMPVDLPLGTYYIRLRAITSTGLSSAWGPIQMIRSRPEPPVASVTLALSSPAVTMTETGTTATMQFTVTRSGNVTGPLTVNLSTNDTSELSVPASVVIPDGQSSVNFTVTALADGIIDGTQTALVQASAVDAVAVNRSISVADTTVPSFTVNDLVTTTLRPTFSWIGIPNAASYEILVVQLTTVSSVFHRQAGITSTSFTMPVDLPLGTYYIRLRAITSTGLSSAWGPIQMIRSRPGTSTEGSGRTAALTIRWTAIPGVTN